MFPSIDSIKNMVYMLDYAVSVDVKIDVRLEVSGYGKSGRF